jgi:hypothetical protein
MIEQVFLLRAVSENDDLGLSADWNGVRPADILHIRSDAGIEEWQCVSVEKNKLEFQRLISHAESDN